MEQELKRIINEEIEALNNLLKLLEDQHDYISNEDIFKMDEIIPSIKEASVRIAKIEMDRRNLVKDIDVSQIVLESNDLELEEAYREIRKVLHSVTLQKETNELLIKQGLSYTNKMLEIINPSRPVSRTYGATGKIRK
ncbi:flagellar protein FlgN [Haloimpatiens lingqiaonensis]|uniref:flagellar protein FlgN n=1 Tax=Haloimpatiens lingqiaonensis TaxID=1380675 RepID=UPI0010FD1D0D|nr:flagellar protein FlgN [Haloimpatiens lingqiaonensis]